MTPDQLWDFLPLGYLFTIAIETPILLVGLSKPHSLRVRVFSGVWLTACTYPIVVLVLPLLFGLDDPANDDRTMYLLVAETFAPLAECVLFWAAFGPRSTRRDYVTIIVANLASFGLGEWLHELGWIA